MARFSQFAVAAAGMAIENSGLNLEHEDRDRIGVLLGNGNGGLPNIEQEVGAIVTKNSHKVSPFFMAMELPNMAAGQVSIVYGLRGYNSTVTTACAAGTQAIGEAAEIIRHGRADVMVTGGTEAGMAEISLAGFCAARALSTRNDEPHRASRAL